MALGLRCGLGLGFRLGLGSGSTHTLGYSRHFEAQTEPPDIVCEGVRVHVCCVCVCGCVGVWV